LVAAPIDELFIEMLLVKLYSVSFQYFEIFF